MFIKTFKNGAGRTVLFTLGLLAPCAPKNLLGQALNIGSQSGNFFQSWAPVVPSPHNRFVAHMTPDVDVAQNDIANPTHDNDPIKEKTTPSRANAADSWGLSSNKKSFCC